MRKVRYYNYGTGTAAMKIFIPSACYELKQIVAETVGQIISEEAIVNQDENGIILTLDVKHDIQETKKMLQRTILASHLDHDYTIADDASHENDIAILKTVNLEQLGVYVCDLCGMVLQTKYERDSHQTLDHKVGSYGGF